MTRILTTLPPETLRWIDELVNATGLTRSAIVRAIVVASMRGAPHPFPRKESDD